MENYVESKHGLFWEGKDDAWFLVSRIGRDLNWYVSSIRHLIASLLKIEISGPDSEENEDVVSAIAHNRNIFLALRSFRTLSSLTSSCLEGEGSAGLEAISEPISISESKKVVIQINKNSVVSNNLSDSSSSNSIVIPSSGSSTATITFADDSASRNVIENNITRSRGSGRDSQIFIHELLTYTVTDKQIVIRITQRDKQNLSSQTIFEIRNDSGRVLKRSEFDINSYDETEITKGASFEIDSIAAPRSTATSSFLLDDRIVKFSESNTQSTYYEIKHGGKTVVTTISEYIKNDGYYNVDGKKVKLKLSNAKPKGISDAKKRN